MMMPDDAARYGLYYQLRYMLRRAIARRGKYRRIDEDTPERRV